MGRGALRRREYEVWVGVSAVIDGPLVSVHEWDDLWSSLLNGHLLSFDGKSAVIHLLSAVRDWRSSFQTRFARLFLHGLLHFFGCVFHLFDFFHTQSGLLRVAG